MLVSLDGYPQRQPRNLPCTAARFEVAQAYKNVGQLSQAERIQVLHQERYLVPRNALQEVCKAKLWDYHQRDLRNAVTRTFPLGKRRPLRHKTSKSATWVIRQPCEITRTKTREAYRNNKTVNVLIRKTSDQSRNRYEIHLR